MMFSTVAGLPYKEIHKKNVTTSVYGSRVDVINNGETEIIAHGVRILPQGFYTFQYAEIHVISDDLEIIFPSDSDNSQGLNNCLVLVYKPSKEVIRL